MNQLVEVWENILVQVAVVLVVVEVQALRLIHLLHLVEGDLLAVVPLQEDVQEKTEVVQESGLI